MCVCVCVCVYVWMFYMYLRVSLCTHTHTYFSFKKSIEAGVAMWKLLWTRVFNHVPHCKNKHVKCEESPNAIAICQSPCISTVLCLSVVLAWRESVTSHSVWRQSSFYPLSLVWLWGYTLLSSGLPFFFFFFPDGLDLLWGMLLGRRVQGLIFDSRQPLFLFHDFLPHLVVLQEVLSYLTVDFPPFESFLSWENTKLDYLLVCWIQVISSHSINR